MIDILSNHLYSSPDVFIRELLQNGVDAIAAKRKKKLKTDSEDAITITLELTPEDEKQISFTDTGTGLTEAEIHRFLAVIGQSSKHNVQTQRDSEDYIGRFGIGLLSCFLVSDCIRVRTRSVSDPDRTLEWCGNPDGTYTISECEMLPECGTCVLLTLKSGAQDYFDAERLGALVRFYGLPLPVPIWLETDDEYTRLNPPFAPKDSTREEAMSVGKAMFLTDFLDYIPLESKSGLFSGVAYILAHEAAPTVKGAHRIYLKNMLLTENGDRLLPKWAFFMRCFLNTNGLCPTASREDFYEDDTLYLARKELAECMISYLEELSKKNNPLLRRIVEIHRLGVQSVAVEDNTLYRTFFPYLRFETSFGTFSGQELLNYDGTIHYTGYMDEFRQFSPIFLSKKSLLVNAGYTYVKKLLERMPMMNPSVEVEELKQQNLEAMLENPKLSDPTAAMCLLAECNELLRAYDCAATFKSIEPPELPVLYTVNEEALLMRDVHHSMEMADKVFTGMLEALAGEYREDAAARLYLNANNPLVRRLMEVRDPKRLRCCIEILYVQALLTGGYPMRNHELQLLNANLLQLLEWSIGDESRKEDENGIESQS